MFQFSKSLPTTQFCSETQLPPGLSKNQSLVGRINEKASSHIDWEFYITKNREMVSEIW